LAVLSRRRRHLYARPLPGRSRRERAWRSLLCRSCAWKQGSDRWNRAQIAPPLDPLGAGVWFLPYLSFNEGYSATEGERLVRAELCGEAIRLARVLAELMPDEAEVWGLLALMLLHDARRDARLARHSEANAARASGHDMSSRRERDQAELDDSSALNTRT
jgi:hypothetical protein